MRLRSSSPLALVVDPLPPAPPPAATSPVDVKREPTPFDELPMSHLISFPPMDSPTSDQVESPSFENFHALQQQYAYQTSASLLRDAFDPYYRLPNSNPTPISDALNMNLHGAAFKPQLHLQDLSSLAFTASQQSHSQQQQQIQQQQQQCIPTSQLFCGAGLSSPQGPGKPSSPVVHEGDSPTPAQSVSQTQASPAPQTQKKRPPRAAISTKDFVPPDVTGLTKREARLVKNRAAAFLSRQRKREEFETMEVRVAQLEQENARLLALAQGSSRSPSPSRTLLTKNDPSNATDAELAVLRSQLAQSRAHATELENEIIRLRMSGSSSESNSDSGSPNPGVVQIKRENAGTDVIPKRSGAGLFGVVLLCALPSLLSIPAPAVPYAASRFSFTPGPGASVLHNNRPRGDSLLEWTGMDIDENQARRKVNLPLSFLNGQPGVNDLLQNLANSADLSTLSLSDLESTEAEFDVSLNPSPVEGKIRVRIEAPPASSSSSEPGLSYGGSSPRSSLSSGSPSFTHTSPPSAEAWDLDFATPDQQGFIWDGPSVPGANVDIAVPFNQPAMERRRVRITLKNLPCNGAEAGEWEVEVC